MLATDVPSDETRVLPVGGLVKAVAQRVAAGAAGAYALSVDREAAVPFSVPQFGDALQQAAEAARQSSRLSSSMMSSTQLAIMPPLSSVT